MNKPVITKPLKYFFKKLEKKVAEREKAQALFESSHRQVAFDDVEKFVRAIMSQNIFIYTVGMNGKHESTLLSKAAFSINKVVRIYYSTSFDDAKQGYIRIHPDYDQQLILVESLHGCRPTPEVLYASLNECHIIRFLVAWLMKRIDWDKTKLNNLELYRLFVAEEKELMEKRIAAEFAKQEADAIQNTLDKHFGGNPPNPMR